MNLVALQQYADAVSERGTTLNNCFGFVDGTGRPICKPGENHRLVYNGHKRVHALKFEAVALPNRLIGHLLGPVGKNAHLCKNLALSIYKFEVSCELTLCLFFSFVLFLAHHRRKATRCGNAADSNLLTNLEQYATSPTRQEMCIYGDPAYQLRVNPMAPFKGAALTPQMEAFNDSMSNVRTYVEWLFGDIVQYI